MKRKFYYILFLLLYVFYFYGHSQSFFKFKNNEISLTLNINRFNDSTVKLDVHIVNKSNLLYFPSLPDYYNRSANFSYFYNKGNIFHIELGHTNSMHYYLETLKSIIKFMPNDTIKMSYLIKYEDINSKMFLQLNFDYINYTSLDKKDRKQVKLIPQKMFSPNDTSQMFKCLNYLKYSDDYEILFPLVHKSIELDSY